MYCPIVKYDAPAFFFFNSFPLCEFMAEEHAKSRHFLFNMSVPKCLKITIETP